MLHCHTATNNPAIIHHDDLTKTKGAMSVCATRRKTKCFNDLESYVVVHHAAENEKSNDGVRQAARSNCAARNLSAVSGEIVQNSTAHQKETTNIVLCYKDRC